MQVEDCRCLSRLFFGALCPEICSLETFRASHLPVTGPNSFISPSRTPSPAQRSFEELPFVFRDILFCQRVEHQVGNRYPKSGADAVDRVFGGERQIVLNVIECGDRNAASSGELFATDFQLFPE